MKKNAIKWIYLFCYLLLCVLPILYITLLIILNEIGYSLRIFPKQCIYANYILLLIVTIAFRMTKPKRILPATIMILYIVGISLVFPKDSETLVLYKDTLCVSQVRDVWLETYPSVYYHRIENWFLIDNRVIYSYRLFR